MKKLRLRFVVLSLIISICACFCLAACNDDNDGKKDDGSKPSVTALTAPTVAIDDNGKATWDEVANAVGYAYKIDDGAEQTVESREVQLENGQSVAVKAKGDGLNYTDSEWSKTVTYTAAVVGPVKLDTPAVNIYIDGLATWGAIANASNYIVKIGEAETETTATSVRLQNEQTVSVQAVGDGDSYLTGDFSSPKTYKAPTTILATPENLTVAIQGTDTGKVILSWDAVQGANGYEYRINGGLTTATVEETSVTVDLSAIDASRLDDTWFFQVRALSGDIYDIVYEYLLAAAKDDGDYSDILASGAYCEEVEFAVSNDDIYTVAEIIKIMNYYGNSLPYREFMVSGTVTANADGDAVLENGFTLFGKDVPELYLAIDERLVGLDVTAMGTLAVNGGVKGLSSYRSVDFDNIAENDRYALVIDTLNAWNMLKSDSKIMDDFYLPVKLYGVNIMWDVDDDDTGAFALDEYGNVTITCPAAGADDIPVMLTATLYIDDNNIYLDDEPIFMFVITADTRIQLAAPKINIDPKTGIATWNEVDNAVRYWYNVYGVINDDYTNWEANIVDITGYVEAGQKPAVQMYNKLWISVRAIGDGVTYKDSEVDPKQYNYYPETVEPDGTPLVFDMTKLTQTGALANANYIFGLACNNSSVFESASASRVVLGNDDSNGAVMGTGFIKVGSSNNNGKITLNFSKRILGVVITARQWNKDQKDKISVNGSEQQTASKNDWGIMYFNFTASKASKTVEIDTDNRVFIQSITVYVED
ncbi:MAG: hypothetical protein K2M89_06645 [Clostridiales bacterium]|nr:hypothetical protein [Clostridiales bacterium]